MAVRSRRQKLLEGMCRTICDRLHERVAEAARARGQIRPPETTSAVYALALKVAPGLLDHLIAVYRLATGARGEAWCGPPCGPVATLPSDGDRQRMLSAVRASVGRSRLRGRLA
jgi:hypothetical protein